VLSPDNYLVVVPGLLKVARKSILIEQQYIRGNEDQIAKLLDAIKVARHEAPALDIRIVLGKLFGQKDVETAKKNLELLSSGYNLKLGKNIRFIDTTRLVHCHNTMVLIDGKGALVRSQNWSNSAVVNNREAGVWLEHAGICTYFTQIFESDWETGQKKIPPPEPHIVAPESLRVGGFVRVVPADYQEV
jgi:phosphatidylserine/phosphatidylglycerophosphate/cardiolipin synthase-like enzyme